MTLCETFARVKGFFGAEARLEPTSGRASGVCMGLRRRCRLALAFDVSSLKSLMER